MAFTKKQWEHWKRANPEKWEARARKIAEAHSGKSMDDAHKAAISKSMSGRTLSDEHRKRISASMRSKSNKTGGFWSKFKFASAILITFLLVIAVIGSTNFGFFISSPPNFEPYSNITVGADAEFVSEHVMFGSYRPDICEEGVIVYDSNGTALEFDTSNENYSDSKCSAIDVHFYNNIYKSAGEFAAYFSYPTPMSGSALSSKNVQIAIATNKIASFALLEVSANGDVTTNPMSGMDKSWSYDLTDLPDGEYMIRAHAQDIDGKLFSTDEISFTIDSSSQSSVEYYSNQSQDYETYSIYYMTSPFSYDSKENKEIKMNGQPSKNPEADSKTASLVAAGPQKNYDKNMKLDIFNFDYPLSAETEYKASFKGSSGGKHDLRFEVNGTYYEYDIVSIYYTKDNGKQKEIKLDNSRGVITNSNKLKYSNIGNGIDVNYEIQDSGLVENITIPNLNFLSLGSSGDVVIESNLNIPSGQRLVVYGRGPMDSLVIYDNGGTPKTINVTDSTDPEVKEGTGIATSDPMKKYTDEIGLSKHKLDIFKYIIINPTDSSFKKLATKGDIDFIDGEEKTSFYFPAATAFDSNGSSIDLKYEIENVGGQLKFRTIIPADWLSFPERAYPLTIDPETKVFNSPTSDSAMALSKKGLWRDNNGYWYITHLNNTATNGYESFLSTNNTASGAWAQTKLCGTGGIISTNRCLYPTAWMDKFNNTLHVVFDDNQSFAGTYNWRLIHAQCYINNNTAYTLSGCWESANGTAAYDVIAGNSTHNATFGDIAIDRDQNMYISYRIQADALQNFSIAVKKYNRTHGWTGPTYPFVYGGSKTTGGGTWNVIDVASTGTIHSFVMNMNNAASSDNYLEHTKSTNGGQTWVKQDGTAGNDSLAAVQCLDGVVTIDDKIVLTYLDVSGSNYVYAYVWNDTSTTIPAAALLSTTYDYCPAVGDASNGAVSVFWPQRTAGANYLQYLKNMSKEQMYFDAGGPTIYRDPVGSGTINRSGDFSIIEKHATISSTTNNLGFVAAQYNGYNSIWHDTRTMYDNWTTITVADQGYQVMPMKEYDLTAIGTGTWSHAPKNMILRDSKGYYYYIMLSDWQATGASGTAGGSVYISKSIEPGADPKGIVYFNTPKKILGYNESGALMPLGCSVNRTVVVDVSGWIDQNDYLHLAYQTYKNLSRATNCGAITATGPYNNILYSVCTNLSDYNNLSNWQLLSSNRNPIVAGIVGVVTYSYNYEPNIMADYGGNIFIIWSNDTGITTERVDVAVRQHDDTAGTFTKYNIDSGTNFSSMALDVDGDNVLVAAYRKWPATSEIRVKKSTDSGATWTKFNGAAGYDLVVQGAQSADITVTNDGRVFAGGRSDSATAQYGWANSTTGAWVGNLTAEASNDNPPSLSSGPTGEAILIWNDRGAVERDRYYVNNTFAAPNTWGSRTMVVDTTTVYRSGDTAPAETRAKMNSNILAYGNGKVFGFGGWYLGTLNTTNTTTLPRCMNIWTPGRYLLSSGLTGVQNGYAYCIKILVSNVELDCQGNLLLGNLSSSSSGIIVDSSDNAYYIHNITIRNCLTLNHTNGIFASYAANVSIINCTTNSTGASEGIDSYYSVNTTIENCTAKGNMLYGYRIYESNFTTMKNNVANNGGTASDGIQLLHSHNSTLINNTANSNDLHGIQLYECYNLTLTNNTASHNTKVGFQLNTIYNSTLTNNTATNNTKWDIEILGTSGVDNGNKLINFITNITFNLTYNGNLTIRSAVSPGADSAGYRNLSRYINVTNSSPGAWMLLNISYGQADIAGMEESELKIMKYAGGQWTKNINLTSPRVEGVDTANNHVWANITNFTGIFAPMEDTLNVYWCRNLTNSNSYYTLQNNLTDAQPGWSICMYINASNITFDCAGNNITKVTTGSYGIYVNKSFNATVKNCIVNSYTSNGIVLTGFTGGSDNCTLLNNTVKNTGSTGIVVGGIGSQYNNLTNNFVNASGYDGVTTSGSNYNILDRNTITYSTYQGVSAESSTDHTTFTNNIANNNGYSGFEAQTSATYLNFTNNTANNNGYSGFLIGPSAGATTFTNNRAANNGWDGFYLGGGDNMILTNNNATNNTLWDYRADDSASVGIVVYNLLMNTTNVSFTHAGTFSTRALSTPPADPAGYMNVSTQINASGATWLWFNMSYNETVVANKGFTENSMILMKKNATGWFNASQISSSYGNDTTNNYVWANITETGSGNVIYAPMSILNIAPTINSLLLNSTYGTNYTDENLTAYVTSNDSNLDSVTHIYDWKMNGTEIAVGLWPFDTNSSSAARDYTSYANNGTVTATWTASGKTGGAYVCDWTHYIAVPDNNTLDIQNAMTISAWLYPRSTIVGYATHIINKWTGTADANYVLYYFGTTSGEDGAVGFYGNAGGTWKSLSSHYTLPLYTWTHVAWTYTSTGGGILYINGVPQSSGIGSGVLATNTNNLPIGVFNGTIDDVRIYNRSLSAGQIKQIYFENSEIGKWTFDTNNATDFSGNLYNGAVVGATWNSTGKLGGAYEFDGTTDYISISNSAIGFSFPGTQKMTISAWVKPKSTGGGVIASKFNSGVRGEYALYLDASLNVVASREVSPWSTSSTGAISANIWHHIVYIYNSTHVLIYIDNILNKTTAFGGIGADTITPFYIGAMQTSSSPSSFFNGTIDQVRVYNYSIDATQVDQLYNEGLYGYASTITDAETTVGENWSVTVTPNDGKLDGAPSSSGNLTIRDKFSSITQIIVDDYDSVDSRINNITLDAGGTRRVICNGTATDIDGYADITKVNATFYDTAVAWNAADDNNTHYTNTSCYLYSGVGNSVSFNCTFDVYYYANSTDWRCNATITDNSKNVNSSTDDNHIDDYVALDSNTTFVYFGTVAPQTNSSEKNLTVTNRGNVRIDLSLNGTDFNCSAGNPIVPVGTLKYNCTAINQNFNTGMANLTTIASSTYCSNFDLLKKVLNNDANSSALTYWRVFIPVGTQGGVTCNSTVRIAASKG